MSMRRSPTGSDCSKIKLELEDLAFKYEHPQKYAKIMAKLNESATHREKIVEEFVKPVKEKLDAAGFKYEIKARVKARTPFSTKWRQRKCLLKKSTTCMP